MKYRFYFFSILGCFLLMLIFPQETFLGAQEGLLLWFEKILPSLLPFIILSNLLVSTNAVYYISQILKPFLCYLFQISEPASYAVFIGFLCGYPMGAKTISDLSNANYISQKEGQYLLSFCNNTSPMFITSFIVMQNLKDTRYLLGTLFILLISPVLCSFLFRKFYQTSSITSQLKNSQKSALQFDFQAVDTSILNAFETITKIGGYMILFSILFQYAKKLPLRYFLPFLEISNGIPFIINWDLSFSTTYILVLGLSSFGGFCSVAQTCSMIQNSNISIYPYIIQKLITAMVTSLLAFLYVSFIHR